jgi:hypothetical protein
MLPKDHRSKAEDNLIVDKSEISPQPDDPTLFEVEGYKKEEDDGFTIQDW